MSQIHNPYLPLWEHVPDGEPHLFDGRVYIYGSHDIANGTFYCPDHYTTWSAPEDDLSDWKCEGVIYRRNQDPSNADDDKQMWAPDVCRGADGRYYMYYCLNFYPEVGVAVSDSPAGPFEFYGHVKLPDGSVCHDTRVFDPAVLVDDDGRAYLYVGFTPGGEKDMKVPDFTEEELAAMPEKEREAMIGLMHAEFGNWSLVVELEKDMLTMKTGFKELIPGEKVSAGTSFAGHGFFEASSIRKFDGKYYFVYSSHKSHDLCYATSDYPDRDFAFGGVLVSNGDIGYKGRTKPVNTMGNNHGGIVKVKDKYYIFYHRQTNGTEDSRQGCAEKLTMRPDGGFDQVEITSCGLNGGPLYASGSYPAAIYCNMHCRKSLKHIDYFDPVMKEQTKVAQQTNEVFVTQIEDGTVFGYKYFAFLGASMIVVELRGAFDGSITVSTDMKERNVIGEADIHMQTGDWDCQLIPLDEISGTTALYFGFHGKGSLDMKQFSFISM